jgi:hypothetical protein
MPTVTLSAKTYSLQPRIVEKFLKSRLKDLQADVKIHPATSQGWVQVDITGEDEKVALRYLADEIGLCPVRLSDVEKFSTLKGYITAVEKDKSALYVDLGIFQPRTVKAAIPLQCLQAQLGDGRKVALKKLSELFGFCENSPLSIKILGKNGGEEFVEASLSEDQLACYRSWTKSLLDRLVILGASIYDIRSALKMAGLNRDVLNVEPLGLFEFAVKCKLGTDAAGLVPRIGKNLRSATFTIFNPRKVLEFLDYSTLLIS